MSARMCVSTQTRTHSAHSARCFRLLRRATALPNIVCVLQAVVPVQKSDRLGVSDVFAMTVLPHAVSEWLRGNGRGTHICFGSPALQAQTNYGATRITMRGSRHVCVGVIIYARVRILL